MARRAAPARSAPTPWRRPARSTRTAFAALPDGRRARRSSRPTTQTERRPRTTWPPTGPRRSADAAADRRSAAAPTHRRAGAVRRRRPPAGSLPFLAYVAIFLLVPTLVGASSARSPATTAASRSTNVGALVRRRTSWPRFGRSIAAVRGHRGRSARCSARCWRTRWSPPGRDGLLRRVVTAASGVLAQFGGVTLAFAFLATIGFTGVRHVFLRTTSASNLRERRLAVRAAGPDPGLHLLPDPADGDRLPARARRHPAAVAGGGREPRRHDLAVLAPGGRAAARPGVPRLARCCCSPTPSPRTRPRPPWSARAARSCRCRSAAR